jgi:hypothetical protein
MIDRPVVARARRILDRAGSRILRTGAASDQALAFSLISINHWSTQSHDTGALRRRGVEGAPTIGTRDTEVRRGSQSDYDASDELEYFFNWFPWALRGVYPPPAYPPV